MEAHQLTAREALERLPGELRIGKGGLRIFARYHNGELVRPVKVACFRIPPHLIPQIISQSRSPVSVELLEHVAGELRLDAHEHSELIAEYNGDGPDGPTLRWLDFSWTD